MIRLRFPSGRTYKCRKCRTDKWTLVGTSNLTCANGHEIIMGSIAAVTKEEVTE